MEEISEINNIYGFIYITTNKINGKKYIGQKKYMKGWEDYLGSGTILRRSIDKYGKENFTREILSIAYSIEELNNLEADFIEKYDAVESKDYYNIASGGHGGFTGRGQHASEETKLKMRQMRQGKNNSNYGNHMGDESKQRISEANKGKRCGINNINFGKHPSKEIRDKQSKFMKGRFLGEKSPLYGTHPSEDTRLKISKNHADTSGEKGGMFGRKGKDAPSSRKVICITTDKIFDSIIEASIYYNMKSSSAIGACCRKKDKYKSAGKLEDGTSLVWMYYEDYEKLEII